jgi:hypothetical protein
MGSSTAIAEICPQSTLAWCKKKGQDKKSGTQQHNRRFLFQHPYQSLSWGGQYMTSTLEFFS